MTSPTDLQSAIREINDAWSAGRVDDLESWFDPDIVIMAPGRQQRLVGRAACINSYRDFASQAVIHRFELSGPAIDVFGATAVALCPFVIDYTFSGQRSVESGRDLLVFTRRDDRWWVVWRTLLVDSPQTETAPTPPPE